MKHKTLLTFILFALFLIIFQIPLTIIDPANLAGVNDKVFFIFLLVLIDIYCFVAAFSLILARKWVETIESIIRDYKKFKNLEKYSKTGGGNENETQ